MNKPGAILKVLVCSNDHYYTETELIKALNSHPAVEKTMLSRYSTNDLEHCNVVFIDPHFRETYTEVKEFIEAVREKYKYIVFVICAKQKVIDEFVAFAGDRFRHYFQFDCGRNDEVDGEKFGKLMELCKVEVKRNCGDE